ncbi:hypothetical protein EP10_001934 [Geobacillus icigianus]|uniref:Uncharacterized protein n=2 Tax=Anoxybacillaceae TaxID=3120669 RepID=A0ABU6BGL5_9BACL|nr:hypothetical protein B4113_0003 [Geobacillus sp. B4113_201601]MEB3751093.1 hypothetical protein [Geobacillus icigianus]
MMMKWYQRSFFQPPPIDPNRNEESFRLQPIELDSDKPPFSTLAQFFLTEHVLYDVPELVTVIPIPNRFVVDGAFPLDAMAAKE